MQNLNRYLAALVFILITLLSAKTYAQADKTLLKEGIKLHDEGKYTEAAAKYESALKLNPNLLQAEFEWGFTLFSARKGQEAIPHLLKVINTPGDNALAAQPTDILGSIYDDAGQPDKAIETYQKGIKLGPNYQRLRYNIALALLRQKRDAEAEAFAIEAIKMDPKHASSQQLYAVILQREGKDAYALMAYCSVILLEPNSERAALNYKTIQSIIDSKYKVTGEKSVNVFVNSDKRKDADASALETALALSAASSANKNKSKADILEDQLKTIFSIAGELMQNKSDFFSVFYAKYFRQLAQSKNMPAFSRLISLSGNKDENQNWFKENPEALAALSAWLKTTARSF